MKPRRYLTELDAQRLPADLDFDAVDDLLEVIPEEGRAATLEALVDQVRPAEGEAGQLKSRLASSNPVISRIIDRIYARRPEY